MMMVKSQWQHGGEYASPSDIVTRRSDQANMVGNMATGTHLFLILECVIQQG